MRDHKHRHGHGACAEHMMHLMARGGRHGFGPFGRGFRGGGGPGGPGDVFRAGRMFGDGELRLIALALIAETPRHGYDIIKALEERSSGAYSPSPGVVYPTLTYLEEAGFATSQAEGNKKVFAITDAGRAHLADNRAHVEAMLSQLARFGEKMARARAWFDWRDGGPQDESDAEMPQGLQRLKSARRRLREALGEAAGASAEAQARAAELIEEAARTLEQLLRR